MNHKFLIIFAELEGNYTKKLYIINIQYFFLFVTKGVLLNVNIFFIFNIFFLNY